MRTFSAEHDISPIAVNTRKADTSTQDAQCGDSGLGSSEHGHQAASTSGNVKGCCACAQQQPDEDRKSPNAQAKEEWMRVLEALETVGEEEMLRKLEESIMTGSVPNCHHGVMCRPAGRK